MFFNYRVKDPKGKLLKGVVEAATDKNAVALLREQGFLVIDLTPATNRLSLASLRAPLQKVSFSEIVNFTRQLSTMVTAGLTITDALALLRNQTTNQNFGRIIDNIIREIEAGSNLASAMEKYPKCFSQIYISLIRAGEAGGMLDKVLARLAENLEKQREFNGKVKGAMVYPVIIIVAMVAVIFVMMTVVMPKMTVMYKEFGTSLPVTTQLLINVSDFFVAFWWLMILAIVGFVLTFRAWRKTALGTKIIDSLILRLPIFGPLKKEIILVEFTRTLGLLVGAGLPILEALNIVSGALDNVVYREGIKKAAQEVEKGFPLGVPLSQNPQFPPILGQMTKVGEETGKLDESLLKLSSYFESESDEKVKALTTAIEPIIMVILGVSVGFLVLSIILPIYKLTEAF